MFAQVLVTEFLKLRRSKVPWGTLAALMAGVLGLGLLTWIVKEPTRAAELGLLGAKADVSGLAATWPSFAGFLTQIVGTAGLLILAFIVAYVFGREYEQQTAKNLFALPVGRHWFAVAKLIVAALWWFAAVIAMLAWAVAVGVALGLPGLSASLIIGMFTDTLLAAGIAYLLVPPVAWVTVWSRGSMAPIAFAIAMLLTGNLIGTTGWAVWYPWSIVPILVGSVGGKVETLPVGSYVVVALTFAVGLAGTIVQQQRQDLAQ